MRLAECTNPGLQNLADFKSSSCVAPLSYGILYINLLISVAVYCVDTFTAVNLLLFDKWSGQVKPVIPFEVSRWIFAACIILSWLFLIYRWQRAIRAIKTDSVALSYLDPLAVRIQSVRMGSKGQGWRRFLLFTALTKGRKGSEYVALFSYFSFEAWLRIVFADGPRQAINAITLYTVMQLNLVPAGKHAAPKGHSPFAQFFINVRVLAEGNREQAAVYFGMLFTLVIWLFSALALLLASLMYITYLWHHIPTSDGSLAEHCRRRIDSRLYKIVGKRIEKALAKESKKKLKDDAKIGGGRLDGISRQPTVPILVSPEENVGSTPSLTRQNTQSTFATQSTLPLYESRPNTPFNPELKREPTLPAVGTPSLRPANSRSDTDTSYGSDMPLVPGAAGMGHGGPGPQSQRPPMRSNTDRSMMSDSLVPPIPSPAQPWSPGSYGPPPNSNPDQYFTPPGPMPRSLTGPLQSSNQLYKSSQMAPSYRGPTPGLGRGPPYHRPSRGSTRAPPYIGPVQRAPSAPPQQMYVRQPPQRKPLPSNISSDNHDRLFTARPPLPQGLPQMYDMQPRRPPPVSVGNRNGGYVAFNPARAAQPPAGTVPVKFDFPRQRSPPVQRAVTVPLPQNAGYHDSIYAAYGGYDNEPIQRAGTADPRPSPWRSREDARF